MTVANNIRKYRTMKNMTQKELGDLSGIKAPNIGKYERGYQNPKIETLKKIANALDIPVTVLMSWEEHPEEKMKEAVAHQPPIIQYLYSLGYVYEVVTASYQNGHLLECTEDAIIPKHKRYPSLVDKKGNRTVFTEADFEQLKQKLNETVDFWLWSQNHKEATNGET